jgi:MHS family proline/betaine transporter-like MFS transporter
LGSAGVITTVTIFDGFAPFIATWLIAQTGDPLSPNYYLMATALLSIIALMAIERRGRRAVARSVVSPVTLPPSTRAP